jgi:putative hydrolase of the HAD superfamily
MADSRFHVLFSDIGGVLGTNGWDGKLRAQIAEHFGCNFEAVEGRHRLLFDTFERGYMGFDEYLRRVYFDVPREFTLEEVRQFAFRHSIAWPETIAFLQHVKTANGLKLALISNEGQGLAEHRSQSWKLRELADFIVFSHGVHMRKPDPAIWQLALELAQANASEAIFIDDREMFANIAGHLGFSSIHHVSLEKTRKQLQELGLVVD